MRQVAKVFMVALFATAVWTSSAKAVEGWFFVTLVMSGTQDAGDTYVNLTADSGAFTGKWFKLADPIKKEGLAIALTSIATDSRLFVRADPDLAPPPGLEILHSKVNGSGLL